MSAGKRGGYSKGVATSFGFRRRTPPDNAITTSLASSPVVDNHRITSPLTENVTPCDNNGNADTKSVETVNQPISRLCATRLPAPKKESIATHGVSRFGFRQTRPATAIGAVRSDNAASNRAKNNNINNNNVEKPRAKSAVTKTVTIAPSVPKHKLGSQDTLNNVPTKTKFGARPSSALPIPSAPAVVRCTMHTSQLPKPQIVRVRPVENVKTAKTAANNSRKEVSRSHGCSTEESGISSKEGSVTGDSGIGSQTSSGGDVDLLHTVDLLSPDGRPPRPRHLGTLVTGGRGVYDVRDLADDEFSEDGVVTDVAVIPLPRLPSVFSSGALSTGVVRERTREYQSQLDRNNVRNVSPARETRRLVQHTVTDLTDQEEEEKSLRDLISNEKSKQIASGLASSFRHFDSNENSKVVTDSVASLVSSFDNNIIDEPRIPPDWSEGGEAMLDSNMYEQLAASLSAAAGEESSVSERCRSVVKNEVQQPVDLVSPVLQTNNVTPLISPSGVSNEKHGAISKNQGQTPHCRSVLVTIEDPFAAVAARSCGGPLLDDETSPQDSLISSLTEESEGLAKRGPRRSSKSSINEEANSKELRSPISPASPGTPTNTSLSLSEGRDFLIDDEIADQPALMFDESITTATVTSTVEDSFHNVDETLDVVLRRSSDSTEHINDLTLVNVTPKRLRRRHLGSSLAASEDTLSPCDSITSDDLMLDFEHSQSSGIDDSTDRYAFTKNY